jgi:hypothetical protein
MREGEALEQSAGIFLGDNAWRRGSESNLTAVMFGP